LPYYLLLAYSLRVFFDRQCTYRTIVIKSIYMIKFVLLAEIITNVAIMNAPIGSCNNHVNAAEVRRNRVL
jgi:hypothetical protein